MYHKNFIKLRCKIVFKIFFLISQCLIDIYATFDIIIKLVHIIKQPQIQV